MKLIQINIYKKILIIFMIDQSMKYLLKPDRCLFAYKTNYFSGCDCRSMIDYVASLLHARHAVVLANGGKNGQFPNPTALGTGVP